MATEQVRAKFSRMAEEIVAGETLRAPKFSNRKTDDKIRKLLEADERLKSVSDFIEAWNRWRKFYFDRQPIQPKNLQQISAIEGAIEFAEENELPVPMLIACVHRAHIRRKILPNFTAIKSYGLEAYDAWRDDVMSDIDGDIYERDSLRRGSA